MKDDFRECLEFSRSLRLVLKTLKTYEGLMALDVLPYGNELYRAETDLQGAYNRFLECLKGTLAKDI